MDFIFIHEHYILHYNTWAPVVSISSTLLVDVLAWDTLTSLLYPTFHLMLDCGVGPFTCCFNAGHLYMYQAIIMTQNNPESYLSETPIEKSNRPQYYSHIHLLISSRKVTNETWVSTISPMWNSGRQKAIYLT